MSALTLDLFTTADDFEAASFRFLAALRPVKEAFANYHLQPHFQVVRIFHDDIHKILTAMSEVREGLSRELLGFDKSSARLRYSETEPSRVELLEKLIQWSAPQVGTLYQRDKEMFDLVEENLRVETVGGPSRLEAEGYCVVPDRTHGQTHMFLYSVNKLLHGGKRSYALRSRQLFSVDNIIHSMSEIQEKMMVLRSSTRDGSTVVFCDCTLLTVTTQRNCFARGAECSPQARCSGLIELFSKAGSTDFRPL